MTRTVCCLVGILFLSVSGCQRQPPAPESLDVRTAVPLPPEETEAVRAEMRLMLTSLNQLHLALATGDTALGRRAAVASGMGAAEDPALESMLPAEFLRLAVAAHSEFDSLALAISARAPRDTVLTRLARITTNCVACHAIYRLTPAEGPQSP